MAREEAQAQKRRPEEFLAQNPQTTESLKQQQPQRMAIDLTQLRAAKAEVREAVNVQEANAQKVVLAAWALLEPAIPRDASLRTLLG